MSEERILAGQFDNSISSLVPFSKECCDFINRLSFVILHDRQARTLPDLVSLGYWCSDNHIDTLKSRIDASEKRIGRGISFHVAPSNIPINFVYSYLFGIMSGNACIVKVPSRDTEEKNCAIRILKDVLEEYPEINRRTRFIEYDRVNEDISVKYSQLADIRVIWGGDDTVRRVRAYDAKPRCVDVVFADRYSIAVINGEAVINSSDEEIEILSKNFYNDTYYMDQNACSSPQTIFWINDSAKAREKFWDSISKMIDKKNYNLADIEAVNKYTRVCEDIIDRECLQNVNYHNNALVIEDMKLNSDVDITEHRGRCGQFYETSINSSSDICNLMSDKVQTVSYYGINPEELYLHIQNSGCYGIDRIVPIGRTMDIDTVWDGYDLIRMMSRIISVEA